ncbi:O-antigen ligase family protein [Caenispirillum bisanense]|uniref:O-antigen ligase family protein n=1 Tax=Caenispirillum bisanense TaxID=414052 RepID=UPI0031DC61ED
MGALAFLRRPDVFAALFTVFVAAGYLVRPNPTWAFPFYALILPLTLWLVWRERHGAGWLRDPALLLALAAAGWYALSILWSVDPLPGAARKSASGWFTTSVFLLAGTAFFATAPAVWLRRLMLAVPAAAVVNAVLSLTLFALDDGGQTRLHGWAETRHPILGANVMIFAGVLALPLLARDEPARVRLLAAAALVAVTVFVLATGSRGPTLAWGAVLTVYAVLAGSRALIAAVVAAGGLAAAVGLVVASGIAPDSLPLPEVLRGLLAAAQDNLNRPSYRMEIWSAAIGHGLERPLIGRGIAENGLFKQAYNFPHSLYVSAFYYTGVVGLALVLALLATLARRALRRAEGRLRALLAATLTLPAVAGLTDLGSIIRSPEENWYILWLPVVLVIGLTRRARQEDDLP